MIRRRAMDHEDRANRFLGSMEAVRELLTATAPGFPMQAEPLAYLMSLLADEAKLVVTPYRAFSNDDDEDDPG
ncbi:hypothetical protein [Novosphingobium sp.]|uniref:hypothetical protein n=1 Tax=Novosphingobium sp. TaxID=1874826 RepID=UPI00286E39D4|nr:hypothetical protein [Novosphingobium sp.]